MKNEKTEKGLLRAGHVIGFLFALVIIVLLYLINNYEPYFTIKKVGREKFEFFTNYVNYFGSNHIQDGIKHEMIPRAGAVVVVTIKNKRLITYYIKESEITTKYAKDTAFVRTDYERLYNKLWSQVQK